VGQSCILNACRAEEMRNVGGESSSCIYDLLVNSAGIHSTTLTTTPSGMETVFCVNHLAPFLLTQALLPAMPPPRSRRLRSI